MKRFMNLTMSALAAVTAMAHSETSDSLKVQEFNEVVVEAKFQRNDAQKTTYIPTSRYSIIYFMS